MLEYAGLLDDPRTPDSLRGYLCSFRSPSGTGCHAFVDDGTPLSRFGGARKLSDDQRLSLVLDLLTAVNHLHCRGSAHLDLGADVFLVRSSADGGTSAVLLGLGAAVRLQAAPGRSAFQMSTAVAYHAPETFVGALLETNLRALMLMDAWSVGVLLSMIIGGKKVSPFTATPKWSKGEFAPEAAVSRAIKEALADFSPWLQALDAESGGFLFRHGWLVKVLLGLLSLSPKARLTVHAAWRLARDAVDAASNEQNALLLNRKISQARSARAAVADTGGAALNSAEFARFRKLSAPRKNQEPFRSLEAIVNIVQRGGARVVIEQRPWKGVRNYGEVIGFRNRADGDRWDVFVPGASGELPIGEPLQLKGILGVLLVKGGNHKLAVELVPPHSPVSRKYIDTDVRRFISVYKREHPGTSSARIRYLELNDGDAELEFGVDTVGTS